MSLPIEGRPAAQEENVMNRSLVRSALIIPLLALPLVAAPAGAAQETGASPTYTNRYEIRFLDLDLIVRGYVQIFLFGFEFLDKIIDRRGRVEFDLVKRFFRFGDLVGIHVNADASLGASAFCLVF